MDFDCVDVFFPSNLFAGSAWLQNVSGAVAEGRGAHSFII